MSSPGPDAAAILLVDDNPQVAQAIALAFACAGHRVDTASNPQHAYSLLARARYDAVLLDLNFTQGETSGAEGFACLARIMADDPGAAVVVITAHSGIRLAVAAMQAGAFDFVMKPWRNADLVARVEAAIAKRRRPAAAATAAPAAVAVHALLGDCAAIVGIRDMIRRVAPTPASVIVAGRSGSGRSLVASLLHAGSPHADGVATVVDVRGSDAWEAIDGAKGTLVLRHPDRLDDVMQARLAERVTPTVRPIAIVDDVGSLSSRLRGRLGTIEIVLPPLDRRGDDPLLLARHFAHAAAARHARSVPPFTASAEAMILSRAWEGEVRGLAQAIERAVLLDDDGVIDAAALAPRLAEAIAATTVMPAAPLDVSLEDSERVMIEAALRHHHHNVSHAAQALGLSRQALYRRMTRHGL